MTTVTQGDWSVSVTTGTDIVGARLNVCRFPNGLGGRIVNGEADGKSFPDSDSAWAYALEHGYTQVSVKPWCPRCRVRHTFLGKRSAFCSKHRIFTWED